MAKNYTFNEAVKIIAKGTDLEAITDIGRRYPVLAHKIAVVTAKAGEEFVDLMGYMPDYLTANKVNTAIKAGITESGSDEGDEVEDTEVENETPKNEGSKKAKAKTTEDEPDGVADYNKLSGDTLIKMCKEKGIYERGMKKAALVKALEDYDVNGGANTADEEENTDSETTNPYEGKSAMELFKECKARKIKAAPKKPAKFYADLLIKDDAANAEATEAESEEDDNWGDDEEAETPKKAKAAVKDCKAKAAKKVETAQTDDDDWDI